MNIQTTVSKLIEQLRTETNSRARYIISLTHSDDNLSNIESIDKVDKLKKEKKNLAKKLKKKLNTKQRKRLRRKMKRVKLALDKSPKFRATNQLEVNVPEKIVDLFNAIDSLIDEVGESKWIKVQVNRQAYVISPKTKGDILNKMLKALVNPVKTHGSDAETILEIAKAKSIRFSVIPLQERKKRSKLQEGGFFKFLNPTKFDLSRYGVFHSIDTDNYNINCLTRALVNSEHNITVEDVTKIVKTRNVPMRMLKTLAESLKLNIIVKRIRQDNGKTRLTRYGNKYPNKVNLGLIEDHYFLIEKLKLTTTSLKLMIANNDHDSFEDKARGRTTYTDSFKAINKLLPTFREHPITLDNDILATQFGEQFTKITSLDYDIDQCTKPIEVKDAKKAKDFTKVFFDFEATTHGDFHSPYMVSYLNTDTDRMKTLTGIDCGLKFLQSLPDNALCIAHNMGYDYQFLAKYIQVRNMIKSGNKILMVNAIFYNKDLEENIQITFKDSFALISAGLKSFGKMFGLKVEKEVMPYELYNVIDVEDLEPRYVQISLALQYVKQSEQSQFLENLNRWDLHKPDNHFDALEYAKIYCEMDVNVLAKGYETFRKWCVDDLDLDIDRIVSSASLAYQYGVNQGAFEDCHSIAGVPREFIQRCIVGGRVLTARGEKFKVEDEKLVDFDAVSLYPSAIVRQAGFLKGLPKVIKPDTDLTKVDGFFVECNIKSINIPRDFPLVSKKLDNGIRNFSNDLTGTVYLDKIAYEDLKQFQDVEIEIVQGYYFDEGRQEVSAEVIKTLFNKRLEMKAKKNPSQMIYKLIMNSFYGKTIMKPITSELKFFYNVDSLNKHIVRYHNYIEEITVNGEQAIVKQAKPIVEHFSSPHIGAEILSMSKRIMNEVMCTAEDNDMQIYYQDTDSMHLGQHHIPELVKIYKAKYGRDLIGKQLGQFHSDFDFDSDEEPYAIKSIFLGKKCYIDQVRTIKSGVEKLDNFHIRMKGVPGYAIKAEGPVMETYERLFNGEEIEFDLLADNHVNFKRNKDFTMSSVLEFKRRIKF